MGFVIAALIAWIGLLAVYYGFGSSPKITAVSGDLVVKCRLLSIRYFGAIFLSVWSGFWIATLFSRLGAFILIGGCMSFLIAVLMGYLWARYRLGQSYVDQEATVNMLKLAAEVREFDESAERVRLQLTTIPGQPAWKVLLFLASLQALGALVGYVTVMLTS